MTERPPHSWRKIAISLIGSVVSVIACLQQLLPGSPSFVHNRRRWAAAFVRLPIIPVCLPALSLRYPMRELDPPGRRRGIAAQQTGRDKKNNTDVKKTIHTAR